MTSICSIFINFGLNRYLAVQMQDVDLFCLFSVQKWVFENNSILLYKNFVLIPPKQIEKKSKTIPKKGQLKKNIFRL